MQRAMQSTLANIDSMSFDDIIRHFADSSQMEQSIGLANKLSEIIKGQTKASANTGGGTPPKHEIELNSLFKLFKYTQRTKNPRLYYGVIKQSISYIQQNVTWKERDIKSICWLLNSIINLDKLLYTRFEIIQDLMKEVLNRKNELTQLEIVKLIEAMINLEQTGGLMMASQLQIMLSKSIETVLQSG